MAGEAAALLDELMGRSRNVIPGKEVHEVEWWNSEVGMANIPFWLPPNRVSHFRCAGVFCVDSVRATSSRTLEQTLVRYVNMAFGLMLVHVCIH